MDFSFFVVTQERLSEILQVMLMAVGFSLKGKKEKRISLMELAVSTG
jgi:hypothetical protein